MKSAEQLRKNAVCRSDYHKAEAVIRALHADVFDGYYAEEQANGLIGPAAYSRARRRLVAAYKDDVKEIVDKLRAARGFQDMRGRVRPGAGVPKRQEMDSLDALILFERGMTVKQMAEHDNCTQRAAAKALVPQLMGRRSPSAGWWVQESAPITSAELSKRLGCHGMEIQRVMDGLPA